LPTGAAEVERGAGSIILPTGAAEVERGAGSIILPTGAAEVERGAGSIILRAPKVARRAKTPAKTYLLKFLMYVTPLLVEIRVA
jgi:hypothetical protein